MTVMKKNLVLWFIAAVCIIASCTKDAGPEAGMDPSDAMLKAKPVHGPVVVLPPSGGDDTDNLLAAIAAAEPGTTIQLTAGDYHLAYIEVFGFEGCIKGAGRDKTIIKPYGLISQLEQEDLNYLPAWIKFIGGDVVLSDFAIVTGDGPLVSDVDPFYIQSLISVLSVNNYNQVYNYADKLPMKFRLNNVDFQCGYLDPDLAYLGQPYNVIMPVWIGSDVWWPLEDIILTSGTYTVTNCTVENAFQGYEAFSQGEDAVFTLDRCSATDCLYGAFFAANFNSRLFISNNSFKNIWWIGVDIEDVDWGLISWVIPFRGTEYTVTGNVFSPMPGSSALVFLDSRGVTAPDNYKPTIGYAKNNLFNLVEGSNGIRCLNNRGAVIWNNRFAGVADYGIQVDGSMIIDLWTGDELGMDEAENVLILGNNFNGLETLVADIVMGEMSSNCTVVGNGSVIDSGTDNTITGMSMRHGGYHAGHSIRDNFRMMPRPGHHPHH